MKIEEVKQLADAWQEESKDSRAIMVIAIETTEVSEEQCKAETTSCVRGQARLCKEAMKAIITDRSEGNALRTIISHANLEVAIDKLMTIGGN